jgi:cell wall-associated NlpC family hydrolase
VQVRPTPIGAAIVAALLGALVGGLMLAAPALGAAPRVNARATSVVTSSAAASPAAPAAAARIRAALQVAYQWRDGAITVSGWADDRRRPDASITVGIWSRGRLVRVVRADLPRTAVNRAEHFRGRHGFRAKITGHAGAVELVLHTRLATHHAIIARRVSKPGARVVALARRYVGRARYVTGGDSPKTGFDCSGFTRYLYQRARVAVLPHVAQDQRFVRGMHVIARRQARPGDLVFYLSGGSAFHVAVYAGRGWQYAAATPRDGIRFQRVWSSAVEYRTDWH